MFQCACAEQPKRPDMIGLLAATLEKLSGDLADSNGLTVCEELDAAILHLAFMLIKSRGDITARGKYLDLEVVIGNLPDDLRRQVRRLSQPIAMN